MAKIKLEDKKRDKERYAIASLWQIMCCYIVILFVKGLLLDNYFIHFSIDMFVAIVAFYISIHNTLRQYQILKVYSLSKKPLIMVIVTIVVALFITFITIKSPFDISFLILVIGCLTGKRIFDKELNI